MRAPGSVDRDRRDRTASRWPTTDPAFRADLLPRIFEPRFSTTTSGSGLGLAIVRRLVEGWGGAIEVESEVGRGTRVLVRMAG